MSLWLYVFEHIISSASINVDFKRLRILQSLRLRDRDAIVTREGIIFRVYGSFHPSNAYVCDPEYAPAKIFKSADPKAPRTRGKQIYYKFFADEGIRFVHAKYPQFRIFHEPLQELLVGVDQHQIWKTRKPDEKLQQAHNLPSQPSPHISPLTFFLNQ